MAHIIGGNEILNLNTMFSGVTYSTERRPIRNDCCVYVKSDMDAQKPEVVEFT
jgi:hypothetical protein